MKRTIEPGKPVYRLLDPSGLKVKSIIDEATRTIWHPITREVADRCGDIVRIDGGDLSEFTRKPAVLYGHDYQGKNPVTVIGENVGFRKEGDILFAGTKFLPVDTPGMSQPLKDLINDNWLLHKAGLMGWSIGFIPTEMTEMVDGGKFKGYDFKAWKLLEYSSVIIPAHQDAVNNSIRKGLISGAVLKDVHADIAPEDPPASEPTSEPTEVPAAPDGEAASAGDKPASIGEAASEQAPPEPDIKEPVVGMTILTEPKTDEIKPQGAIMLKDILEKMASGKTLEQGEIDYLAKMEAQQLAEPVQGRAVRRLELVDESNVRVRSIKEIVNLPPRLLSEEEKEIQKFNDDVVITSTILRKDPRQLKMWENRFAGSSALRKALDASTSGEGSEFAPSLLSADIITAMRLEAKVAALFPEYPMPSNPWVKPYFGGIDSDDFYLASESTSDSPTASPASTPDTSSQTFTARKLKARILFSDELIEDSIVAILPTLKADLAKAGARVKEDIIINGDTTATHMDSDVTDSKDRRKAWNGLRDLCPASTNKADHSTFSTANILTIKTAMGRYGLYPGDLAFITGAKSYNKFMGLTETLTVDKYGPQAVVLNGELAKFLGIPIVVSGYIRENLNASGVYDGVTETYTQYLLVNRNGFALGARGGVKLTFLSEAQVDQNQLIMSFRSAFQPLWTPSTSLITIAMGYKVS